MRERGRIAAGGGTTTGLRMDTAEVRMLPLTVLKEDAP
jgi:hypothetical protein